MAALAVAGAGASAGLGWRIALAILGPLLLIVIWGRVMAPRARRRLRDPARLLAEVAIYLAAVAPALVGDVVAAIVYGVIAIAAAAVARMVAPEA